MPVDASFTPPDIGEALQRGRNRAYSNRLNQLGVKKAEMGVKAMDEKASAAASVADAIRIKSLPPEMRRDEIIKIADRLVGEGDEEEAKGLLGMLDLPPQVQDQMIDGGLEAARSQFGIDIPEQTVPRQPSLQLKEGTDASGNSVFGAFNPATGQTVNPDTGKPIPGFRPSEKGAGVKVDVNLPGEENKNVFGEEIAKRGAEKFSDKYQKAQDAIQSMRSDIDSERLMDDGIIAGIGANFLIGAGKALSRLGFHKFDDPIANTEAYVSQKGNQVAQVIKAFGSGTGLSDADRKYAERIAGGDITVSEGALRYISDINNRRRASLINEVNDQLKKIPPEYRVFMEDLEVPVGYEKPSTNNVIGRIKKLASFNRVVEGEEALFDTIPKVKQQLREEGYPISGLTDEQISAALVSGAMPTEPQVQESRPSDIVSLSTEDMESMSPEELQALIEANQ